MGILDSIKSALGIDGSRDQEPEPGSDRAVTEPAAGNERAVKESVTTETDTGGSTASVSEESPGTPADDGEAAEPGDAAGSASGAAESTAEPTTEGPTDDGSEDPGGEPSVESIDGIGLAYATRLADAGVESVADLADADADALADETGISAKRLGRWIEAASEA